MSTLLHPMVLLGEIMHKIIVSLNIFALVFLTTHTHCMRTVSSSPASSSTKFNSIQEIPDIGTDETASIYIINSRVPDQPAQERSLTSTEFIQLRRALEHLTDNTAHYEDPFIALDFAKVQKDIEPVVLECAGVAYYLKHAQFRDQLRALQQMPLANLELVGENLSQEEKEQVRDSIISSISVLQRFSNDTTHLIINRAWITPLPEKAKTQEPVVAQQSLTRKIFNPTTLSVGALCALVAWYAAKNSSAH